jgi:hypothetical protein
LPKKIAVGLGSLPDKSSEITRHKKLPNVSAEGSGLFLLEKNGVEASVGLFGDSLPAKASTPYVDKKWR